MLEYNDKMREIAARLLKQGEVQMVIGFQKGSLPMTNQPCVIKIPEAVDRLHWDSHCGINLANYLPDRQERIGILAKGCDSRNIVTHILENKIKRDQLVIIGVPCQGMLDRRKITQMFAAEIEEVTEQNNKVIVKCNGSDTQLDKIDLLQQNCAVCVHRNPVIYDELVGELVEEQQNADRFADVEAIEAMSAEERWNHFDELLAPCIRCYACRNACPLCYCPTCFVDESRPQWVGKSQDATDVRTFHFLRAFHCAGRCTDCGACERACPVGINMREFTKKLEQDCRALFGWEPGLDLNQRPPLDTYRPEDPNDFIK